MSTQRFIRINELASRPGFPPGRLPVVPATVWRWVREGKFPSPVKLGPGTTAWRMEDVTAWEAAQEVAA